MKTPRSRARGISFSMPMLAMWSGGTLAPMSALPSLVQTTNPPVSATAKLAPVMPASAAMNFGRAFWRIASARLCGSESFGSVPISSANRAATSVRSLWMAGTTMWLGGSSESCWMRSPRSDSVTSMPRF